jgi:hypothetical protein
MRLIIIIIIIIIFSHFWQYWRLQNHIIFNFLISLFGKIPPIIKKKAAGWVLKSLVKFPRIRISEGCQEGVFSIYIKLEANSNYVELSGEWMSLDW